MRRLFTGTSAIALMAMLATGSAQAQATISGGIVPTGTITQSGTGLGHVNTILTVQGHPANRGLESGCIGPNRGSSTCGFANQRVKSGRSQSGTIFLSDLTGVDGSSLSIVLNFVEPGNALSGSLDALVLTMYDNAGATVFSTTLGSSVFFPTTFTGTGKSGFAFGLTPEAALAFDAAVRNGGTQLGLGTSLSKVTGGHESFYLTVNQAVVVTPEPATLVLFGTGLFGLVGALHHPRRRVA